MKFPGQLLLTLLSCDVPQLKPSMSGSSLTGACRRRCFRPAFVSDVALNIRLILVLGCGWRVDLNGSLEQDRLRQ